MRRVKNKFKISGECSPLSKEKNSEQAKAKRKNKGKMTVNTQSNRASIYVRKGNGMRFILCVCVYNDIAFFYSNVLNGVFMREAWGI